jgi:hypothetical protein
VRRRIMKAAIPIAVLLALGISPASGIAQSFTATPLIEVEARGIRTTDVDIPLCGNTCQGIHPHFLSYRVAIMTDGTVVGSLTENDLENRSSRAVTRGFRGTVTPEQMAALRSLLLDTRIGFEEGGCTAGFSADVAQTQFPTRHNYLLAYSVLWFGRGNRANFFELPAGAEACEGSLRGLMQHILLVARDAAARATSLPAT